MWRKNGENYVLTEEEERLKKWLPALSDHDVFNFRKDIEVEWTHEWPSNKFSDCEFIFFVRDPRDAIYSRYRRENPEQSFRDFVEFPDIDTLLDKVDNWSLFNKCWLACHNINMFRFEDYKMSAVKTLTSVLQTLGLHFLDGEIERAVNCSTYARAAKCEEEYRRLHPEDREIINRGGRSAEWKILERELWFVDMVEVRCGDLLEYYGYERSSPGTGIVPPSGLPNIHTLRFFRDVFLPDEMSSVISSEDHQRNVERIANVLEKMMRGFDWNKLNSNLRDYEVRRLICSLVEFVTGNADELSFLLNMPPSKIIRRLNDLGPKKSISSRMLNMLKRCIKNQGL